MAETLKIIYIVILLVSLCLVVVVDGISVLGNVMSSFSCFVDFIYNLLLFFVIYIYLCLTLQCDVKVLAIVIQHLCLLLKGYTSALKVIVMRCVKGYCKHLQVVKVMKFLYCV